MHEVCSLTEMPKVEYVYIGGEKDDIAFGAICLSITWCGYGLAFGNTPDPFKVDRSPNGRGGQNCSLVSRHLMPTQVFDKIIGLIRKKSFAQNISRAPQVICPLLGWSEHRMHFSQCRPMTESGRAYSTDEHDRRVTAARITVVRDVMPGGELKTIVLAVPGVPGARWGPLGVEAEVTFETWRSARALAV